MRRLADASLEELDILQNRGFAADKPQHDALVFDKTQRLEISRSLRVVFQQEMVHFRAREKSLRDGFISAGPKIMPLEVTAAHMHAKRYARRRAGDGVVEAFDVEIDQMVGLLSGAFDLLADRRIA